MKLLYKIKITGTITLQTGMHIGGAEVDLDIGGIDNAVAKDKQTGRAYIPGSSLKGKLRDLIARHKGYKKHEHDKDETLTLFGRGADRKNNGRFFGNLIVRDSFMVDDENVDEDKMFEDKAENTIDRPTGAAKPRHIERVVKDNVFELDMILDIYDKDINDTYKSDKEKTEMLLNTLRLGFRLLEHDYLGGSGTRGYGKVKFNFDKKQKKLVFTDEGKIMESDYEFDLNLKYEDS